MQTHSLDSNECFSFAAEQQYAAKQAVLMGAYPFCVRPRDVCAFCETKPKGTLMKKESPGQAQAKPADQPQDQPQSEDQPKAADQSESYYNPRSEKFPHALKHGAFSALSILPGEDPKEFIELYQSIAAELLPDGPIEKDAVKTIALSIWRASRLTIFRRAEWARAKYGEDEQKPDEVPETEPARSQYKKLIDSAKQHERAGHVLHDIATMKIEKHIDPATLSLIVPSMILQPLVENSIKHGLAQKLGEGRITIRSQHDNGHAIIDVIDNGVGIPASTADRVKGTGIGLRNVNERLRVIYGANYQLQLDSVPGEGTCARVIIPETTEPARIPA